MTTQHQDPVARDRADHDESPGQRARQVAVGVDGTSGSQLALRWAVEAARLREAPLNVILVADPAPATHYYPYKPPYSSETFMIQGAAPAHRTSEAFEHAMSYARDRLPTESVVGTHTPGRASAVLLDATREAELMVLGSRGRSPVTAALLGSVSTTVSSHASCPVVVTRTGDPVVDGHRRVVAAVDGSADSHRALSFAFAEAALRKLPVTVVCCWSGMDEEHGRRETLFTQHLPETAAELASCRERYPDVDATTVLLGGDPAIRLVDESLGAELVVVGTRGRGRMRGLLLGSVSQHLLRHAHCPVAVAHRRRP
ncbi:universal stress protein [Phytoactinopolyspora limicola]|uniref:universal stress protein n=1 Tax=Phytoactinopolyspora limicola TaxID=2715536 RepID=UPI00140A040A|nr:universal stress protein [Phytoactinopolyspora limicola]